MLRQLVFLAIFPGDYACNWIGIDSNQDSGMFRGFVNSIIWGFVAFILVLVFA